MIRYPKVRPHFAKGDIQWDTATQKVAFVGDVYTAGDEVIGDIVGGIIAEATLTSPTVSATGVCLSDGPTYQVIIGPMPVGPPNVTAIVVYQDDALPANRWLIVREDAIAGLPFTPTGAAITITWDSINGIFKVD